MQNPLNPFDSSYYTSDQLRQFGFARVGEDCWIARNCTIMGLENISLGDHVRIDGYTSLIATRGSLRIGSHVHLCSGCMIGARGGVDLGDFSSLSHGVRLLSATDDFSGRSMTNSTLPEALVDVTAAPIIIGRYVPIGGAPCCSQASTSAKEPPSKRWRWSRGRCRTGRFAVAIRPDRSGPAHGRCSRASKTMPDAPLDVRLA